MKKELKLTEKEITAIINALFTQLEALSNSKLKETQAIEITNRLIKLFLKISAK